jgi:hypothetical protein
MRSCFLVAEETCRRVADVCNEEIDTTMWNRRGDDRALLQHWLHHLMLYYVPYYYIIVRGNHTAFRGEKQD